MACFHSDRSSKTYHRLQFEDAGGAAAVAVEGLEFAQFHFAFFWVNQYVGFSSSVAGDVRPLRSLICLSRA